jgi:hypothetical protein
MATPTQAITVHGLRNGLVAIANRVQLAPEPSGIAQQKSPYTRKFLLATPVMVQG